MTVRRTLQIGLAGAAVAGGALLSVPGIASAATGAHTFATNQQQLEQQLANRVTQLGRLSDDVAGSKTLSPTHLLTLNDNIATATTNIKALVIKVPTDTTGAELATDRASMLQQNRVFAVLTPQVFQTIEADAIAAQVTTFQADEASLQSSVNGLLGEHGYQNALNHYFSFVKWVNSASSNSTNVVTAVLAQTPADFPGDTHVFTHANHELLNADIALAHASYDENIIGLASGGYTGS